jgi:hypothetical protein
VILVVTILSKGVSKSWNSSGRGSTHAGKKRDLTRGYQEPCLASHIVKEPGFVHNGEPLVFVHGKRVEDLVMKIFKPGLVNRHSLDSLLTGISGDRQGLFPRFEKGWRGVEDRKI